MSLAAKASAIKAVLSLPPSLTLISTLNAAHVMMGMSPETHTSLSQQADVLMATIGCTVGADGAADAVAPSSTPDLSFGSGTWHQSTAAQAVVNTTEAHSQAAVAVADASMMTTELLLEVDIADAVVAEALRIGDEQTAAVWKAAEKRTAAAEQRATAAEQRAAAAEQRAAAAVQRAIAAEERTAEAERRVAAAHCCGFQSPAETVGERRLLEQAELLTAALDAEALRASSAEKRAAAMEALLVAELQSVDQDELEECHCAMLGFREMYNEERGWV